MDGNHSLKMYFCHWIWEIKACLFKERESSAANLMCSAFHGEGIIYLGSTKTQTNPPPPFSAPSARVSWFYIFRKNRTRREILDISLGGPKRIKGVCDWTQRLSERKLCVKVWKFVVYSIDEQTKDRVTESRAIIKFWVQKIYHAVLFLRKCISCTFPSK